MFSEGTLAGLGFFHTLTLSLSWLTLLDVSNEHSINLLTRKGSVIYELIFIIYRFHILYIKCSSKSGMPAVGIGNQC